MKPATLIILFIFFLMVPSCIDPIDFSRENNSINLVVDGLITNAPGPYTVYLTRTSAYNAFTNINESVDGAIVTITDDMGNSEILAETIIPGIYKTDPSGIRGIPGRQYKIEIETPEGKQYESKPELLSTVPGIDSVYYERQQLQELDDENIVKTFEGFQIYMDIQDPENMKNYYMWSWTGTHEINTQFSGDCCAICWVTDRPGQIDVSSDNFFDGNPIIKRPVTFVKIKDSDGARNFRGKYHVEVRQLSLTIEAYNYWLFIKDQMNSTGSIFDPPPAAITGNIINVNDPENTVFGYFGASAIATKGIFIPANEAPYQQSDTLIYDKDCRLFGNSTAKKPSFW